jgi:hypothetical protein
MSATDNLKSLVINHIQPELKKRSFRKKGQIFWRETEKCLQIIEIDYGERNSSERAEYSVELGVYYPEIVEKILEIPRAAYLGPVKKVPGESDCLVRQRLALLEPKGKQWRCINQATDIALEANEVIDGIVQYGIPWLEANKDITVASERLLELTRKNDLTSALYLLGMGKQLVDQVLINVAMTCIMQSNTVTGNDKNKIRVWAKLIQ